jgi:phage terminase large subunit
MFKVTTALEKMLSMEARKKVVQGATSSGKTYGIIPIIYDKLVETARLKATVVAETLPAVKEGAVDIFINWMQEEGRWVDACWNASTLTYTRVNRSKIQFKSFDSVGKAKASGKRDILFLNEANHIPFEIADALMTRSNDIWMDFNADTEFWAHTEILTQPNSEFLKLTYKDNEAIPPQIMEELMIKKAKADQEDKANMRGYWWNWWQVYGLGEIGNLQGSIFNNWKQCDFIPDEAQLKGYGLDFGYTNDPTALTSIYYMDGAYYLDEVIYEKGLTNADLNNKMKSLSVDKSIPIYADSAEPKSIKELKLYGWRVVEAIKGKDSVNFGIQEMQKETFFVTKKSLNLINEFRKYMWKVDKEGKAINQPIDAFNHAIDGIRYYFQSKNKQPRRYYAGS